MRSRNICFTSFCIGIKDQIMGLDDNDFHDKFQYIIFGTEICPTTGRMHLQGYCEFVGQHSFNVMKQMLLDPAIHLEPRRGTADQAIRYCKKDNVYVERGIPKVAGKRKDLDVILDWLDDYIRDNGRAPSDREIAAHRPDAFLKYKNFRQLALLRAPQVTLQTGEFRDGWQSELEIELVRPCTNDREIKFMVDVLGGKGKSWFQRAFFTKYQDRCQMLKVDDYKSMAYALDETKDIFLINIARGGMQYLPYRFLEDLKDRVVFSTKYESRNKILSKIPHIVVFCNEDPDSTKMTIDRYNIVDLTRNDLIPLPMLENF